MVKKAEVDQQQTEQPVEQQKPISGGYITPEIERKNGVFIVTAIQNNTDLVPGFAAALIEYAAILGAEIITCPILYNKNAWAQPDDTENDSLWFASFGNSKRIENRVYLNDNVLLIGNAHVLPTAKNPLSGFDSVGSQGDYVLIPASKIALSCQPALKGEKGKTLLSTGTVTQLNYINRKAGVTAELEHSFGFVVVEPGKHPRSVEFKNGEFFDFNGENHYSSSDGAYCFQSPNPVLVLGDIHAEKCDDDRKAALNKILRSAYPSHICIHDLHDFTSRNHHNRKSPFFRFSQDYTGNSVLSDVETAYNFLGNVCDNSNATIHVITSNHDLALNRWIEESDWHEDPLNAETYLTLALAKIKSIKEGKDFNALETAINTFFSTPSNVRFNGTDESLMFYGAECGNHGDKGANGAKGSIQGFRKLGQSMVVGHSHSPAISGHVYQVGVSGNMDMGYNEGPSSWRHAHCLIFPNGQKQLIME